MMEVLHQPQIKTLYLQQPVVDTEFKNLIPPLSTEEHVELEKSLLHEGCRDSIVTWNNTIIDGHNRYEICTKNNIPYKIHEMRFAERDDVKIWIINNQLARRNIDKWQRLELAELRRPLIAEKAKSNYETYVGRPSKSLPILATIKIDTREEMAKDVGVSHGTLNKMVEIKEKKPEIIPDIQSGKTSINKVFYNIKIDERREEIKNAIVNNPPLPTGKYDIIYVDPPWKHNNPLPSRATENHYPTQTLEELSTLHVPAEKNCIMLMWTTATYLEESFILLKNWGFQYKSHMIWDKEIIGTGWWFRNQHELLLVAVKGENYTPLPEDRISSVYRERRGEHSKKPDFFYNLIEKMFPNKKYLEMFARKKHSDKWDVWGNEV